jgi:cob(I)alamin adenosyltransferase
MTQGFIQVYTGNGKGKTTAALGLALRAAGAGKKVFIAQFVKGMHYSELNILPTLPGITVKQYGRKCFIREKPVQEDYLLARSGLEECAGILLSGEYDIVILDEANIALYYGLFSIEELKSVIVKRASHTELVITGRYAPPALIEMADLVTEMKEIKHYYTRGVEARLGIEK